MNKKSFLLVFTGVLSVLLIGGVGTSSAAVVGVCSDCHVMHQTDGTGGSVDQYGALTKKTCQGCHTAPVAGDALENGGNETPYVMGPIEDGAVYLAGGVFDSASDAAGHTNNSHSMGSPAVPVGYDNGGDWVGIANWYAGNTDARGLSCAGTIGCHGTETTSLEAAAIAGGHHENSLKLADNSLGYRMLRVGANAVLGTGATDYEEALISAGTITDVNTYSAGYTFGGGQATISHLCAKCHGLFHSGMGVAGEWLRHPTDVPIPTGWDIDTIALDASDYQNNPVGVDAGGDRYATCLSCHRAHGTAYTGGGDEILRWAYSTQNAGSGTADYGCLGCHDRQR